LRLKNWTPVVAALLGSSMLAGPAWSQTQQAAAAEAEDNALGDIVVTAQRREESLQDVPISIQALGTQKLEELNVTSFNDYTRLLPSVAFQSTSPGNTTVYFRGVASGGDGNHSGSLPSVGFYLDEQPITTIGGTLDVHIYDIARIEALAGPQGTLYGASSQAGTIRIITNKPDPSQFLGGVNAEVNSVRKGGVGGLVEGFVNVPLAERIALRVVGFYRRDAGYIDNVAGTRTFIGGLGRTNAEFVEKDFNSVDTYGGRAALGIELDDDWTATLSAIGQEQKSRGSFGYDESLGDLKVQRFNDDRNRDRFIQAALTIQGKIGNWDLTYAGAYMHRKRNSSSDYIDYAEAYDQLYADYGGLAGYFYYQDNAGNPILPQQIVVGRDNFKRHSQELRISSPSEERFRVVGGLFYMRQSNDIFQDYQIRNLGTAVSVNNFPGTLWLTNQKRVDRDYAIFGEASFDVTDRLTITGGVRGYKFDNTLIGFFGFGRNPGVDPADGRPFTATPFNAAGSSRTGVAGCFNSDGRTLREVINNSTATPQLLPGVVPGTLCTNLADVVNGKLRPKRTKDEGLLYRANITWKPIEDKLLYATVSKGFRPGGINRRAGIAPYDADFLENYELGWKTTWGSTFRWNGAVYQQEWKDFQFSFLGENSFTVIQNGPDARIRGIETDLTWSPTLGLTINASAAYTDAKTKQSLCLFDDPTFACTAPGPGGQANRVSSRRGIRLPVTPKFKFSGSARYEFEAGPDFKPYIQTAVTHSSSAFADLRESVDGPAGVEFNPRLQLGKLPSWTTVDLALGTTWSRFSAEIFATNLFDERAQTTRFVQCGSCYPAAGGFAGFSRAYAVVQRPQTIGVRAGYKF
jgi:outer membrane receptor protein involved in Fe transport